jgi:glycosyltransferase involved in cell wall biosynthesis
MNIHPEFIATPAVAKPKPQVSIGMPVYNGAKFIREALDSLLAQTFTDFELIISDNASTDGTEAICREYAAKDVRVRYVRQAQNRGAIANFQYVLDEAVGGYFMWAAADDVWGLSWIETLLPISAAGQCIAFGTVQTIDGNGNSMKHPANGRNFSYTGSRLWRRLKYYFDPGFLGKACPIYGIYPKHLLSSDILNILAPAKAGTDMLFVYALLAQVEIKWNSAVLLYKRIHEGCEGGDIQENSRNGNITSKIWIFFRQSAVSMYKIGRDYGSLSTGLEQAAQVLLFPFALAYSMAEQIKNNPRFAAK